MRTKKKAIKQSNLTDSFECIAEMGIDAHNDITLAEGINLQALKEGDKDPMFVTVRVLSETISNNNNRYTKEVLESVKNQILSKMPDGYLGHLSEADRSTKYPDPQTLWIGADLVTEANGKTSVIAKGYVLPDAKIRTYLKKAALAKKKISVSIYGQANRLFNRTEKCYDIKTLDLESIDWARSGSQGVKDANLLAITQETMKTHQDHIASATMEELEEFNSDLIQEISESVKGETVKEMKTESSKEVKTLKSTIKEITEELGESPLEKVAEMRGELEGVSARLSESVLISELSNRVSNVTARKLLQSMSLQEMANVELSDDDITEAKEKVITLSEMKALKAVSTVLESDEAKGIIKEMTKTRSISPIKPKAEASKRSFTKTV